MESGDRLGSTLAGFRIDSLLGRGGMGVVYVAEHLRLHRRVALKVIAPELAEDPMFAERFSREAELAAALDHPNIIPVYDAGDASGVLYIAMRLVDGPDLGSILASAGPVEPRRLFALLSQVAEALDAAHAQGLVHRDVKPANILVERSAGRPERVFITDFGLMKRMDSAQSLTQSGFFLGTVNYASPEQLRAEHVDGRADQYALACVMFEALTGSLPFRRDLPAQMITAHLFDPPPRITAVWSGAPPGLDEVIVRALAKLPDDRFASCHEFVGAASRTLEAPPVEEPIAPTLAARPPMPHASEVDEQRAASSQGPSPSEPPHPLERQPGARGRPMQPERRRTLALVAALVATVLVAGSIFVLANGGSPKAAGPSGAGTSPGSGSPGGGSSGSPGGGSSPRSRIPVTVYFHGAFTGPLAPDVEPSIQGATVRFAELNQDSSFPAIVTLKQLDTVGLPDGTQALARGVTADPRTVAVEGPAFTDETVAVGDIYNRAGIPFVTPSATGNGLSTHGWSQWYRTVGTDDVEAPADGEFIAKILSAKKLFLVDDGPFFGRPFARTVGAAAARDGVTIAGRKSVTGVIPDFGAAIDAIRSSGADTVFFGGIASEFSQLVLQARAAGLRTTRFVSGEPSASSAYLDSTGTAANGTFVSSFSNMSDEIVAKYRSDVGSAAVSVPAFAAEGYDVASLIGAGISDAIANGARSPMEIRAGIRTFLDGLTPTHPFHGEAKDISFQPDHELQGPPRSLLFFYRVNDGHLHLLADADRLLD